MSEALATQPMASDQSGSIICCPGQLCAAVTPAQLPWARLIVGIFVAAQTMTLGLTINITAPDDPRILLALQAGMLAATLVVALLLGLPLARQACAQLRQKRLSMELFFILGITASLAISIWSMFRSEGPVYFEVVSLLLVIYSVGHAITSYSRARALSATESMLDTVATARLAGGRNAPVTELKLGDRVKVMPGELIPVDGKVTDGQSLVRTTAFSGEWQSSVSRPGDRVLAGSACEDGTLIIESTSQGTDRRIDQLANLIASACQTSSPMQRMADRFVRIFLPIVLAVSGGTLLYWGLTNSWITGLFNALAVVLVACPCAAGLAVPLATWTAIGRLARRGLLLKGAESLQRLASVNGVTFDKTGTLSDETLELAELQTAPEPQAREKTLTLLAEIEKHSEHPVARALRGVCSSGASRVSGGEQVTVHAVQTLPGRGIEAHVQLNGRPGKVQLTRREDVEDLVIDATLDGAWIATAVFTERLRQSAARAVEMLRDMGLPARITTGDSSPRGAAALGPTTASMTPEGKHNAARAATTCELFVGDGINDAAAMAASHASIAMASGAAITIEAADATLHGGDLTAIPESIALSRRALATIHSNFAWAVLYNVLGMTLAATGVLHPVIAALLMSLSSAVVAWRSFRLTGSTSMRTSKNAAPQPQNARSSLPPWLCASLHAIGLIGQGLILIALAQLDLTGGTMIILACAMITLVIVRFANRLPVWLDMTLAMLTLGGLGMNLGWWMDLSFDPAIRNGTVAACCMMSKTLEAASPQASSHWMFWMMLLLGVPAMYLLRRGPIRLAWRDWCCTGMLLLGVPGMCFGMWAGAHLAMGLDRFSPQAQVVLSYAFMVLGMCVGMLVPHALELAFPRLGADRSS